ncbi:MAG: cytochrome c biogenesis protein CcdA [Candidatus Omnitrophota bacterium]
MPVSLSPLSILAVFSAGVLVSFAPCVYPLIPVTLSYIGVKGSISRLRGFFLSLLYASGLSVTFSILGTFAALSGKVFGAFTQSAYFYFLIGNIYILLGLSLFDLFNFPSLRIPLFANLKIGKGGLGIFFLGMASGLVIGPCTTPVLGAILSLIAKERNVFLGIILLSSFAFGTSSLLILAGTFSSFLYRLPKAGVWNNIIKKISAIILIAAGEYLLLKAGSFL